MSFDFSTITEWLKILVPALGAWFLAHLANRRDTRRDHLKWESMQQDKLTAGWSEMTAQSREIITRLQIEVTSLQNELVETKTRCKIAENEITDLKSEQTELKASLGETKTKHLEALREIDLLRAKRSRRTKEEE